MLRCTFIMLFAAATFTCGALAQTKKVGLLQIEGTPAGSPGPLAWLFPTNEPTMPELIDGLKQIADSDEYDGLMIRLKDAALSATQVEELGAAIEKVKEAGIEVIVFGESFGSSDFKLASHADRTFCQKGGDVQFIGMNMEEMYLADTLEWVGLKADMVQVGAYKGANEQMVNSRPSPEWSANIDQLLDSMYDNLRSPILRGRGMTNAALDLAMEELWMSHAEEAKELGLIDRAVDLADLSAAVKEELDGDIEWDMDPLDRESSPRLDMGNPFAALSILTREPDTKPKRESIAIVHIDGAIVDGDSSMGGFSGGPTVGSRTVRNALQDILEENLIKGVVVRIDSPGGSATASEIIWQGMRRVAEHKPVWVSVGSMAASGGYYLAVAGDRVYVNPSSIVGSIGVVGGKISMEGLYGHLKVNVVSRSRGPRAGLFSPAPWGEDELRIVRAKMTETYNLFASRVSAGRPDADLDEIGEGRLFTGDKAIRLRMADALGGLDVALEDLASDLNLDEYDVLNFPGPQSLPEVLENLFGGVSAASNLNSPLHSGLQRAMSGVAMPAEISAVARQLLGPAAWSQVSRQFDTMMLLREEPVILMSPNAVIFR